MLDPGTARALLGAGEYSRLLDLATALPEPERDSAPIQLAVGLALLRLKRFAEAAALAGVLIARDPSATDAYTLRAAALREHGDERRAIAVLLSAAIRHPGHPLFWRLLSESAAASGPPTPVHRLLARAHAAGPADRRLRRAYALSLAQASGEARFALAPETALAIADRAIAIDPDCGEARSARLFARQCLDSEPSRSMLQDAIAAAAAHAGNTKPRRHGTTIRAMPLKVGFLASGLADSSVRHFVAGLFAHYDPDVIAIRLYDHCPAGTDRDYLRLTERIHVVDIGALANAEVADRIADDAVDILVDLVGHGWYGRRLGVLAERPAPIQIAYCGYLGTLGLQTVDWFLSDSAVHPPDGAEEYVERLLPLPHWICYQPPAHSPPLSPRPQNGPPVFGSFNQLGKVSSACLAFWRQVLEAVPGARLLIKRRDLAGREATFSDRLRAHGLPLDRIDLDARADPHRDHLSAYERIDVALDTYPYSGATTVCEALWMGVPVVALSGATAVSRMSRSVLRAAGLEMWAANTPQEAVAIARTIAADRDLRTEFRTGARQRLAASPLCDAAAFSRSFEAACRRVAGV